MKKEGFEDDFTIPLSKLRCLVTRLDPDTDPDPDRLGTELKGSRICKNHRDPPHLKSNESLFFGRNDSDGCSREGVGGGQAHWCWRLRGNLPRQFIQPCPVRVECCILLLSFCADICTFGLKFFCDP